MNPQQFIEGTHFYMNEEGYLVLTKLFHLEKGVCCGMGCLHCPYHYENVPEPRRTELLRGNTGNKENQ